MLFDAVARGATHRFGNRTRIIVVLVAWLSSSARIEGAELVDRIVAVVDRHAITLSEAEQAAELRSLRNDESLDRADIVERLIESYLIEREVRRYPTEPVGPEDIRRAMDALRRSYPNDETFRESLASKGMTENSLEALVRRQITVSRYLETRFRPLVYVTEEEIAVFYDQELLPELADRGEPAPDEAAVADSIRRILSERKFNERVDQWIAALKSRARIRRYVW